MKSSFSSPIQSASHSNECNWLRSPIALLDGVQIDSWSILLSSCPLWDISQSIRRQLLNFSTLAFSCASWLCISDFARLDRGWGPRNRQLRHFSFEFQLHLHRGCDCHSRSRHPNAIDRQATSPSPLSLFPRLLRSRFLFSKESPLFWAYQKWLSTRQRHTWSSRCKWDVLRRLSGTRPCSRKDWFWKQSSLMFLERSRQVWSFNLCLRLWGSGTLLPAESESHESRASTSFSLLLPLALQTRVGTDFWSTRMWYCSWSWFSIACQISSPQTLFAAEL